MCCAVNLRESLLPPLPRRRPCVSVWGHGAAASFDPWPGGRLGVLCSVTVLPAPGRLRSSHGDAAGHSWSGTRRPAPF